ncbi:MAG: hypothetical protein U9N84_13860 [Actinomycetota bacterium]|nr:hypothetical protein [Actinomycetota bacterium]
MTGLRPTFYARPGGRLGDFVTLLHLPYTMWHLSYVVIGAAMAPQIDALRLTGTLVAFASGLGIGAHALDELHDRPLSTGLSPRALRILGWGGLGAGGALAIAAAFVISPVALAWGAAGVLLAAAYALEWSRWVHSTVGFAVAWGAFPILVGYWAQTESLSLAVATVAAAAIALGMTQRTLSTPARHVRRGVTIATAEIGEARWDRSTLLATWERPLQLLAVAHVLLAIGLLLTHL